MLGVAIALGLLALASAALANNCFFHNHNERGLGATLAAFATILVVGVILVSITEGKRIERSRIPLKPGQTAIVLCEYEISGNYEYVAQAQDADKEIFTFSWTRVGTGSDGNRELPIKGAIVVADRNQKIRVVGTAKTTPGNPSNN